MARRAREEAAEDGVAGEARTRLLAGLPAVERRMEIAGVPTAVLEGGDGPPLLLLHGPGESAVNWRWIIPHLVDDYGIVAPDLPAHGRTGLPPGTIDVGPVLAWLDELIERTCAVPPVVVGHILGGAIGARFALSRSDRLSGLVLVDTLGLATFRPSIGFAATMFGFLVRPNERTYERFMRRCAFDLDRLRDRMGAEWAPFVAQNVAQARSPRAKAAGRLMRTLGLPRIPGEDLARISVPTCLIWGRHDRANRLAVAEAASVRYGWPLHVIEEAADDPARDQPRAFTQALRKALHTGGSLWRPQDSKSRGSTHRSH